MGAPFKQKFPSKIFFTAYEGDTMKRALT